MAPDGSSLAVSSVTDFNYSHYRMLLKLGVAWQTAGWNAGVSVTTPSLGVLGSGDAGYTLSLAGTDANGDGRPDPPVPRRRRRSRTSTATTTPRGPSASGPPGGSAGRACT